MKSLFTRVLIWLVGCACGAGLLFPASAHAGFAPSAASGWTFLVSVKSGTGPLTKSGTALYIMLDTTNVMQIVNLADVQDLLANFTYTVNSSNSHVAQLKIGDDFNATLGFTSTLGGLYAMSAKVNGLNGTQIGDFVGAHGDALASPANLSIQMTPQSGTIPTTASYTLTFNANNTYQRYSGGSYSSTKTVNFNRVNHSTLQMYFNDNLMGNGLCRFIFQTENAGFYILKLGAGNNYQLGKFRVDETTAPSIVSYTDEVTTTVGSPLRLSVEATGMRPMTYKWQKAGKTIAGATGSSYVINAATEASAGNFRVFVSNPLGSAVSGIMTATVLCGTTVAPESAAFSSAGGTNSFSVTSTGGCRWTPVANTNWIEILSYTTKTVRYVVRTNFTGEPRNSSIRVGSKSYFIAQESAPAWEDLIGRTILFNVESGYGEFPSLGKYRFFSRLQGTNAWVADAPFTNGLTTNFQALGLSGPLAGLKGTNFLYEKDPASATRAYLRFFPTNTGIAPITYELTFANGTNGTFFGTNGNDSAHGGNFVVSDSLPDINHDGLSELYWHQTNQSHLAASLSLTNLVTNYFTLTNSLVPVLTSLPTDIDFDGTIDYVDRFANGQVLSASYKVTGTNTTYTTNGVAPAITITTNLTPFTNFFSPANFTLGTNWQLVGINHFLGLTNLDLLFQNTNRVMQLWTYKNTNYVPMTVRNGTPSASGWKAVATVDLNRDQPPDILLQHTDGRVAVWYMNGNIFLKSETLRNGTKPPTGWKVSVIRDMNDDGYPDIVFRSATTRQLGVWYMRGSQFLGQQTLSNLTPLGAEWIMDGPR